MKKLASLLAVFVLLFALAAPAHAIDFGIVYEGTGLLDSVEFESLTDAIAQPCSRVVVKEITVRLKEYQIKATVTAASAIIWGLRLRATKNLRISSGIGHLASFRMASVVSGSKKCLRVKRSFT